MKKKFTAIISMVLAFMMLFSTVAFAGNGDVFLALGEDLDAKGMTTVLGYFGLDSLDDCNITYISNADEHKYLDGKIDYGRIKPQKSLQDSLDSMLCGNDEFNMIDEQVVAYDMIMKTIENACANKNASLNISDYSLAKNVKFKTNKRRRKINLIIFNSYYLQIF